MLCYCVKASPAPGFSRPRPFSQFFSRFTSKDRALFAHSFHSRITLFLVSRLFATLTEIPGGYYPLPIFRKCHLMLSHLESIHTNSPCYKSFVPHTYAKQGVGYRHKLSRHQQTFAERGVRFATPVCYYSCRPLRSSPHQGKIYFGLRSHSNCGTSPLRSVSNDMSGQGTQQQLRSVPVTKAEQQEVPSHTMEHLARKAPRV